MIGGLSLQSWASNWLHAPTKQQKQVEYEVESRRRNMSKDISSENIARSRICRLSWSFSTRLSSRNNNMSMLKASKEGTCIYTWNSISLTSFLNLSLFSLPLREDFSRLLETLSHTCCLLVMLFCVCLFYFTLSFFISDPLILVSSSYAWESSSSGISWFVPFLSLFFPYSSLFSCEEDFGILF